MTVVGLVVHDAESGVRTEILAAAWAFQLDWTDAEYGVKDHHNACLQVMHTRAVLGVPPPQRGLLSINVLHGMKYLPVISLNEGPPE